MFHLSFSPESSFIIHRSRDFAKSLYLCVDGDNLSHPSGNLNAQQTHTSPGCNAGDNFYI